MLKRSLLLSLLSAILLSLPWSTSFSGLILLVAWIPLLWLEDSFATAGKRGCWKYYTLTLVAWNIISTYWVSKATLFGGVGAIVGNSLQMILIFALFRWAKRKTNRAVGYTFLVSLWIAWEYFYFDAEISWPWLVLGNGFAKDVKFVQWYEYTGVLGGSLWVWLVNLALFAYLKYRITNYELRITRDKRLEIRDERQENRIGNNFQLTTLHLSLFALIFLPVLVSLVQFYTYEEKTAPCHVVAVQPNIDPYLEKFGGLSSDQQLKILLSLADPAVDSTTDYVICPETALSLGNEAFMPSRREVHRIKDFMRPYPKLATVIGSTTLNTFHTEERPTPTARKMDGGFYEVYNAALQIDSSDNIPVYHKSKLVIGAEKTPYPQYFRFFEKYIIDLGGAVGAYGIDSIQKVFTRSGSPFRVGVAICYEGIYGRFYTEYIRNGANLMFIISNDGWWGDTFGYKQLLYQSSLRAIETRRSIARSANTGLSALINQRGEIVSRTNWWEPAALKGTINTNETITFYVRYGDYIGRAMVLALVLLLLFIVVTRVRRSSAG